MARTATLMDWTYQLDYLRELFPQWAADHFRILRHVHSDLGC